MIDKLVDFCGVKFVKFQKRNPMELLGKENITNHTQFLKIHLVKLMDFIEKN